MWTKTPCARGSLTGPQQILPQSNKFLIPKDLHSEICIPCFIIIMIQRSDSTSSDSTSSEESSLYEAAQFTICNIGDNPTFRINRLTRGVANEEVKALLTLIEKFHPKQLEIEYKLRPFIPEYIPVVGLPYSAVSVPSPIKLPQRVGIHYLSESFRDHFAQALLQASKPDNQLAKPCAAEDFASTHLEVRSKKASQSMNLAALQLPVDITKFISTQVARYQPRELELETSLKPFIPDYIPVTSLPFNSLAIPQPKPLTPKILPGFHYLIEDSQRCKDLLTQKIQNEAKPQLRQEEGETDLQFMQRLATSQEYAQ